MRQRLNWSHSKLCLSETWQRCANLEIRMDFFNDFRDEISNDGEQVECAKFRIE